MDTKDVLLRKEGDGKLYYQRCGAEAGIPGLSRIFDMLSRDEVRHADSLRALQKGVRVELPQSETLEGARRILRALSVRESALDDFNGDLRAYLFAMDFESTSAGMCGQLAREAHPGWERELFLNIAAEDEMHFTLIEHMRELLEPAFGNNRADGVADAN